MAVLAILTLAAFGCGLFVGFHQERRGGGFNWALAAAVSTATGTTLLAIVTGGLAIVTTADVQASRKLAEEARRERESRERPIVLLEDYSIVPEKGVRDRVQGASAQRR